MDASFKTVIQRFGIRQGVLQEEPQGIAVVGEGGLAGSQRHRGSLYVLVEVLGGFPDPAGVIERLVQAIRSEYYRSSGSITGGISLALRAANDLLFEENLNSPREQRGVAGVSCAVLRDGDLYVGQIGPALAYLAQADGVRRFPEDSPWLRQAVPSDAERAASPPVGVRRTIEPCFYHAVLGPGDILVLASPALARMAGPRAIAEALAQDGPTARRQLEKLAAGRDVNVLIVALSPTQVAPVAPRDDELEAVAEEEEYVRPESSRPEPTRRRPAAAPGPARTRAGAQASRRLLTLLRGVLPDRTAQPVSTQARAGEAPPVTRKSFANARVIAVLVVMIPVLVLGLVAITRYQYERSRRVQVQELLRQADEARTNGVNSGQQEALRQGLRQAITLIDEARAITPDDPELVSLRQQMVDQLDAASMVQRLFTLWELADVPPAGSTPAELTRILVRGTEVFVLDQGGDRVLRRVLNPAGDALEATGADAVLVQKGEQEGPITVGELVDMVWMPAGGERKNEGLLILERNGSLLEWDAGRGISVSPVGDSATWRKPQAAGAYMGNFYLLDPQQNRILKYVAAGNGYTNPPTDYLAGSAGVDLSGAVDMGIDGHIYVLLADGSIIKLLLGAPQPFQITGLDEPLSHAVAICVTGEDEDHGSIYVADAGLARVVQFTKQGRFVRQFKAGEGQADLSHLRGLYVDEEKQRIYLSSGPKLYVAPLPALSSGPGPTATPAAASGGG